MKLLQVVTLCLAVALAWTDHHENGHDHEHHHEHDHEHDHGPDRCLGLEMDAAVVDEAGIPYFFKDGFLFKGFHGAAQHATEMFAELDEPHHLVHVDAAFRLHHEDHPSEHNNVIFFFDDKVYSYHQQKLEEGYPKKISEVFPGIPDHLDAAVECPKPECDEDSVLLFKGHDIYHFNVRTKAIDMKEFKSMPNCTSAFRFMEHYYCLHGHLFSKFDPKTGDVHGKYPKEARDYFMRCANFSEDSDHLERERCSHVHLDAIMTDKEGHLFAFRGHHYLYEDMNNTLKAGPIESTFKEVHSEVDAVFSFEDHLFLVKDDHVFLYKDDESHALEDGSPLTVKEVLGIEGPIDAVFSCNGHQHVHVVKGNHMYDVHMSAHPRNATNEHPIGIFSKMDAAMCGPQGLKVFVGNHFYHFESLQVFLASKALPEQHRVSVEMLGCDH